MVIKYVAMIGASLVLAVAAVSRVKAAEWNLNGNGDWDNNANWVNPSTYPNGVGAVADFSKIDITGNRTINLNTPITIGTLYFGDINNGQDYYLQPGTAGTLTFDNGGTCYLTKTNGRNDRIYAPTILNNNVVFSNSAANGISFYTGSVYPVREALR
jgi:hypothetical protein